MRAIARPPRDAGNRPRVVITDPSDALDAGRIVIALRGEFDAAALNMLVDAFDDAVASDVSDVVVDLAGVEFIGAGWIGTFVRSRARLEAQDRELTLRSPSHVVNRLLELCGLSYMIEPASRLRGRAMALDITPA